MNYFNYLAALALNKIDLIEPDLSGFISDVKSGNEITTEINYSPVTAGFSPAVNNQKSIGSQNNISDDEDSNFENPRGTQQPSAISETQKQNSGPDFYSEKIIESLRHSEVFNHENNSILEIHTSAEQVHEDGSVTSIPEKQLTPRVADNLPPELKNKQVADPDLPPDINITIGKIEVKAVQPERKTGSAQEDQKPQLSLNDYLKSFHKGK